MIQPKSIRRHKIKEYSLIHLRKLFNLKDNEMLVNVTLDKKINNILSVETSLDFDEKQGDK